jgi:hypothetical protein
VRRVSGVTGVKNEIAVRGAEERPPANLQR